MTHYIKGFPQSEADEDLKFVNVDELEEKAKEVMPEGAYYYVASCSEYKWTWRNNTNCFNHYQIVPRALTGMDNPSTETEFLGMKLKTPIMISPIACHGISHADAEFATQKGAALAGAMFTSSTYGNKPVEEIAAVAQMYASSAQNIGPDDIKPIKEMSGLPVIVKGVNCAEDVEVALTAGADGVYVTNHGGREIDGAPATIDVLPEVVEAVNGRCLVVLDGRVRRGSHVFKALALGADLVGIGRPYLYGLALGGPHGAASVINELNDELKIDMQLTGCKTIEDVKHAHLTDFQYAGDTKPSSTDPRVRKPYPVTAVNQIKSEPDAATGASHH